MTNNLITKNAIIITTNANILSQKNGKQKNKK